MASLIGGFTLIIFLFVVTIKLGVFDAITITSGEKFSSNIFIVCFMIISSCFFDFFPYGKFFWSAK